MGTGYTRQSAAAIVDEATIEAEDHNAEFNAIEAAFNGSTGHAHDGTLGEGPQINLTTSVTQILPVANGGTGTDTLQEAIDTFFDGTTYVKDANFLIADEADPTKKVKFNINNIATSTTRTVTLPNSDVTVSSVAATLLDDTSTAAMRTTLGLVIGTDVQPNNDNLTSLANLAGTGIVVRSAEDTFVERIISGTSGQISVTNGNGVAGNITLSLPSAVTITGTMTAGGFATSGTVSGGAATFTSMAASGTVSGNGSGLTNLNASNLTSGTVPSARMPTASQSTWNAGSDTTDVAISPAKLKNAINFFLPAGIVVPYAGSTAPDGWLLCYGQSVSRTTYSNLFAAIGTQHGSGDGSTTFNLPDLRGRVVAGLDNMGGSNANRLGVAGFSGTNLGNAGGQAQVTLSVAEMPAHNHTGTTSSDSHKHTGTTSTNGSHTHTFRFATGAGPGSTAPGGENESGTHTVQTSSAGSHNHSFTTSTDTHNHTFTTSTRGGGDPHYNIQPTMVLNYIIKT